VTEPTNAVAAPLPAPPPAPAAAPGASRPPAEEPPLLVIEAGRGGVTGMLAEVWSYRELLYFLAWRDIRVRYKQTVLGAGWAIIQPVATMLIFTVVFGRVAGLDGKTGGTAYPVFVYAGLLPWMLFSTAVSGAANSLVGSQHLISKVYFPRLVLPLAAGGVALTDFAVALTVLAGLMASYGVGVGPEILLAVPAAAAVVLGSLAVGVFLAALTAAYRDFRFVVPFLMQIWLYATPVGYPPSAVPADWVWILKVNPMAALIEAFRRSLIGGWDAALAVDWAVAVGASLALLAVAVVYFRRVERTLADIV
jgi:lipopolysaccharide transport system permease protein